MAATIRLMRFGKKKQPTYRIIVIDKRKPRNSSYIELLGVYQPVGSVTKFTINKPRLEYWESVGATKSEGMERLLKNKKAITYTE